MYKIEYGDYSETVTAEGLLNFIKIAVINNKDVNKFKVTYVLGRKTER